MATTIHPINLSHCTLDVIEVVADTVHRANSKRFEFITPEQLLYAIAIRPEFIGYCQDFGIEVENLQNELINYNNDQDRLPEGVPFTKMISRELTRLLYYLQLFPEEEARKMGIPEKERQDFENDENYELRRKPGEKVDIPEILREMYYLDSESMARYILSTYLSTTPYDWFYEMDNYFPEKENALTAPKEEGPVVLKAEAFINGKPVDLSKHDNNKILDEFIKKAAENFNPFDPENIHKLTDELDLNIDNKGTPIHKSWKENVVSLSNTYRQKNPLIGRLSELQQCIRILCRKDKNNPLFIGEPGVGKTALIYGLTRMIKEKKVPKRLRGLKVYALDMPSMVAGASYHGEFEKRMKTVLEGAKTSGNCILYIDEIHTICDAGGGNSSINAAELLKPYLEDGSIRFIGCTTYQDYNKSIANKKAIARRFRLIDIKEPDIEECVAIVDGLLPGYEKHHGVRYDKEAVRYAIERSDALIHDRFLPDKAIDIIDEAGAWLQQNPLLNKKGEPKAARYQKVGKEIIDSVLVEYCRIDAKSVAAADNGGLKTLATRINAEIYRQSKAVDSVVRAVMMAKAGLKEPGKPMASLLFVGPTGVGKTEVCKVLAQELGVAFVRFDMSEYTEKHTISKLIGSPAGYVGYDDGGLLTDAIRKTPSCVLLLDEIEKAHSDIYNILLQVMDYACLTDSKGNKADFRNVIVVMTSNAGAQYSAQASVGFGGGVSKGHAMLDAVKKTFKPEFLNRLSDTIVFNDMDREMARLILQKKLRQLSERLEARGAGMTLDEAAQDFLLSEGFNVQYGAREMDRAITQYLTPILTEALLFGKLAKGGHVTIKRKDNGLEID